VEECANLILGAQDWKCANKTDMKYSPASGCYCYNGEETLVQEDYEDMEGSHMFTIEKVVPTPTVQTPKIVKHQAYCTNHHFLGFITDLNECAAAVRANTVECKDS
jgi:hypothetical protein